MKTMQKKCLIVCLSLFVLPSILLSAESSSNSDDFLKTKKSAEQGDAVAQCNLGVMYRKGNGVPQDYGKAFDWYLKSAEQGYADAQMALGLMYLKAKGVPQDYTKALEWLTKSAEQGYAIAQFNLGVMYHEGYGVPQNYGKAFEWYLKAAEQGEAAAQFNLGFMYRNGEGVPKDDPHNKIEAYVWLQLAMEKDRRFYGAFSEVAAKLTQEEEDRANELYKKRGEEIRKRIDAASSDRGSMSIGVP